MPTDHAAAMTPTMGMGALLFLAVWVAMTIATMFPAVRPMVSMFARISAVKCTEGKAWTPVWLFVSGYLLLWTALGGAAYLGARCLTECRSPLAFVSEHWRDGRGGAVRMGIRHGWHCAGCCWALMAMLFPLEMMNIAALAAVTAFV